MLSRESLARIDIEIGKYPEDRKRSAVMAALRIAQEEKGWLATELMDFIAGYLDIPAIAVYEVANFYNMYNLQPVGKYKITICTNLPCALNGAGKIAQYLKQKLGIDFKQTTKDNRFTLKEGECFGACGDAPVFLVNDKRMCSFMTVETVDKILGELE